MKALEMLAGAHWVTKSLILMVGMGIFTLIIPVASKQGLRPELVMVIWMIGTMVGISAMLLTKSKLIADFPGAQLPIRPIIYLFIAGLTIGALFNVLFGQAVQSAPNPAYPVAISNASLMLVCLAGPLLTRTWPKLFPVMNYRGSAFIGVALIILGIIIIARK
jgi:uncharacterized membrane protein